MKLEINENGTLQLEEVFNGVVIKTTDGVKFHICQRDYGIEITYNGVTKYLDEETFNTSLRQLTPSKKSPAKQSTGTPNARRKQPRNASGRACVKPYNLDPRKRST